MQKDAAIRLTPTMERVAATLSSADAVTSWDILGTIISAHPEYGGGVGRSVVSQPGPSGLRARSIAAWMADLEALFDPGAVQQLHGRIAVLGLCQLDPVLRTFLEPTGLSAAIRNELEQTFESLLRQPDELFAGAISDHVTKDAADLLGVEREVRTIAHVLTSKRVEPPLSLGLFGDWGTGKTFFITKLQDQVSRIAAYWAAAETRDNEISEWCTRIVQIEFNAWHYSDSNLWATLVSRIHDALRNEIDPQEDLKQQIEAKVRDAETVKRRAEAQMEVARRRVAAADTRLRDTQATVALRQNTLAGLIGSVRKLLSQDAGLQKDLRKAAKALGAAEAANAYDALEELHGRVVSESGRATAVLRSMVGAPQFVLLVLAMIAVPWAVGRLMELPALSLDGLARGVVQISSSVVAVATWLIGYVTRGAKYIDVVETAMTKAREVREQEIAADSKTAAAARELAVAKTEEEGARAAFQAAQSELQQLQAELTELSPERRLYRLLQDRSRSEAYTKHLGIISLIREDFDSISNMLLELERMREDAQQRPPIQRIILYIDDLDRCRPDRVVEVLEAVHMLLAFPIFTVVVGVDPRWLRQSLLERYPRNLSATGNQTDDDLTGSTPQNYLEKIFQIPFALRRVEKEGYEQLVQQLLRPPTGLIRVKQQDQPSQAALDNVGAAPNIAEVTQDVAPPTFAPVPTRQLEFTAQEKADIERLWSLFTTPRSVKRFINTYRLLRVGIGVNERRAFEEGDYQVPLLLLAIITSSPNEMYVFHAALHAWAAGLDAESRKRDWTWTEVFDAVRDGIVQVDRDWVDIDTALRTPLKDSFAAPFRVDTLLDWAASVARFSFAVVPARQAVTPSRRRATDHGTVEVEVQTGPA